ncbi:MAG: CPBP family intramembrane glutamic endopeptidase [Dethiobacteria bacterium]|jgi:membrane protease YdiL (CAAX protease family)|nr:CPBP family intramembrane metalloprotease [Bacillota bacterium]HOJ83800.1 CPBP family intramembrane metalloprotease [Bacillota bacterium]HOL14592.1 CPBP family intramembrane metalloprotease [Bacillota bacterium]
MVPFNKGSGHNYLVSLIIYLAVIAVMAIAAFSLAYYFPGTFAGPPYSYETKELYIFEPWTFKLDDHLEAAYPEGGLILPLYRNEKQEAVVIFSEGKYKITGQPLPDPSPAGIFLVIDNKLFEEIRGSVIFLPLEDPATAQDLMEIYERLPGLPVIWQSMIPLMFAPASDSIYYYFISEDGEALLPPVLLEPPSKIYSSLALYALLTIMVILMMNIFSLDHHHSRYWETLYQTRPGNIALGLAGAAALLAFGGEMLPLISGLPAYSLLLGYLLFIALFLILVYYKKIRLWDTGLNWNALLHGYFMAIAAAVMFMIITRGMPQQFFFDGLGSAAGLAFSIFIIGLARELIWRGYIQTVLGRQWGAVPGLLITALLAGLAHYATVALSAPELLSYPYTLVELLILAPGSAIVLGYLYLRTENILSCALLHGLLLSLSSLIPI